VKGPPMNVVPLPGSPPAEVAEARDLLAALHDVDLPQGSLLAVCESYNLLDRAHAGLWPPPSAVGVDDAEVALRRVHAVLLAVVDKGVPGLDPYALGAALREAAQALALLHHPGGGAA
jgi:hypothetical protein